MKTKVLMLVMLVLSGMAYADNSGVIVNPKSALLTALKDCVEATTADAKSKAEAALTNALAAYASSLPAGSNARGEIVAFVAAYCQGLSVDQANAIFESVSKTAPPGSNVTPESLAKATYQVAKKTAQGGGSGGNESNTNPPEGGSKPSVPGGTSNGGSVTPTVEKLIAENKIEVIKGSLVPKKPVSSSGLG